MKNNRKGFTLIELLVTMSLIVLFVTGALMYNRSTDKQLSIFREQAKIVSLVHQARSMAITTFNRTVGSDTPCGYGFALNSQTGGFLFKRMPRSSFGTSECGAFLNGARQYDASFDVIVDSFSLSGAEVVLENNSDFISPENPVEVLFIPPDPKAYTNKTFPVRFRVVQGSTATPLIVSINAFGQITTE